MYKKLNFKITIFKTVFLLSLFHYGLAFADLSKDVKWNANLVVVEAAIKAGDYRDAFALLQGPAREGHANLHVVHCVLLLLSVIPNSA